MFDENVKKYWKFDNSQSTAHIYRNMAMVMAAGVRK